MALLPVLAAQTSFRATSTPVFGSAVCSEWNLFGSGYIISMNEITVPCFIWKTGFIACNNGVDYLETFQSCPNWDLFYCASWVLISFCLTRNFWFHRSNLCHYSNIKLICCSVYRPRRQTCQAYLHQARLVELLGWCVFEIFHPRIEHKAVYSICFVVTGSVKPPKIRDQRCSQLCWTCSTDV